MPNDPVKGFGRSALLDATGSKQKISYFVAGQSQWLPVLLATVSPPPPSAPPLSSLLKLSATATLSSMAGPFPASNCVDGDLGEGGVRNICRSTRSPTPA